MSSPMPAVYIYNRELLGIFSLSVADVSGRGNHRIIIGKIETVQRLSIDAGIRARQYDAKTTS